MSPDVSKTLERARKYMERNKLQDAIAEYESVLKSSPGHPEALQMLSDLCTRIGDLKRAAQYYGIQFDRLVEAGDSARASALFARHLKSQKQPPARLQRCAFLLQKQNKTGEAIELYSAAVSQFREQGDSAGELDCLQKIAQLDTENPARQVQLAQLAEEMGNTDVAGRAFLRAAQLTQAGGDAAGALDLFASASGMTPGDRSIALLYADARLHQGDAAGAVELLQPFAPPGAKDTAFLATYGEGLMRSGQLDMAREMLLTLYRQKPDGYEMLFELAGLYLRAGSDDKGISVLEQTREWMLAVRAETVFASQIENLVEAHPQSLPLARFCANLYDQLNREVKYFDSLVRLFDLSLATGKVDEACESVDRLVEIDPYDYRIQERIGKLEGKASPEFLRSINARAAKITGGGSSPAVALGGSSLGESARAPATEEEKTQRALDDLIVQAEIFLQYSLQTKAIERLERIAEMFPGEDAHNERLRALCERANWWPAGSQPGAASPAPAAAAIAPAPVPAAAVDTHRDLAEIAEITRLMYREVTPREVLSTAVREIGKYMNAQRSAAVIGAPGETPLLTAEYSASGLQPAGAAVLAKVAAALGKAAPDALGGISAQVNVVPDLRSMGVDAALGVSLTDKDTQALAGLLFVGDALSRQWEPNESFFLQAIGDQIMISVNHTRLRSLVRTLAVADEKTGLIGRGAYIDCLLAESKRSRTQGTPLALVILQLDHGHEALRQEGDAALETYMNQIAKALEPCIRQGDLGVKYTAWSLAFVLPDTSRDKGETLAKKLRQAAGKVQPAWAKSSATFSAVVADASSRSADEHEDRVTEWINRAEFGLEEIRRRGGDTLLSLAPPQVS
ncbi:MAG TPA: tetratricopeptide repeat protein [Candidatus Acidoferrales bacterium]|nr:tetratricopeptide repeat protein [Candidatus Acidoferrales bacterium]HEV2340486.1 tetratricopeptide repeat protein [Candidatus Acidoferrales bacterium]